MTKTSHYYLNPVWIVSPRLSDNLNMTLWIWLPFSQISFVYQMKGSPCIYRFSFILNNIFFIKLFYIVGVVVVDFDIRLDFHWQSEKILCTKNKTYVSSFVKCIIYLSQVDTVMFWVNKWFNTINKTSSNFQTYMV